MIFPMFAMVVLTVVVSFFAISSRVKSVKSGAVKIKYFQLMQSDDVPEDVIRTTRCVNNMFEVPVLFYVVCTLFISLSVQSTLAVGLAWMFVVFRCAHAFIHLKYNNVIHRMNAFWLAYICVFLLWVVLVVSQIQS